MKKKISVIIVMALSMCLAVFGAACGDETPVTDRMDVQQLWKDATGMEEYPQACLVVNGEFASAHASFVADFSAALKEHDTWAESHPEETVAAIGSHMEGDTQSTVKSLTSDIVKRCHINAVDALEDREAVEEYLGLFLEFEKELDTSLIGGKLPDDGFYYGQSTGGSAPESVDIYVPDGATALALAYFMYSGEKVSGAQLNIHVVTATSIGSFVANGTADLAVMPSNAAANMYNRSGKYKLVMTLTHGNLYIVGGEMSGADSLVGKRVGAIGQGQVPDLVLRYILKRKGIDYVLSDTAAEGKVAISYYSDGASVARALKAGLIDFGLLAEPAASTVYDLVNTKPDA